MREEGPDAVDDAEGAADGDPEGGVVPVLDPAAGLGPARLDVQPRHHQHARQSCTPPITPSLLHCPFPHLETSWYLPTLRERTITLFTIRYGDKANAGHVRVRQMTHDKARCVLSRKVRPYTSRWQRRG